MVTATASARRLFGWAGIALLGLAGCFGQSIAPATPEASDVTAIRSVIGSQWNRPGSKVDIGPVVVASDYAIAGWTQNDHGGRALLHREGEWRVVLCAGDALKQVDTLLQTGVAAAIADELVRKLKSSEKKLPDERLALLSSFRGLVEMPTKESK